MYIPFWIIIVVIIMIVGIYQELEEVKRKQEENEVYPPDAYIPNDEENGEYNEDI